MEKKNDDSRWEKAIIHVDMDAFFASIEIRDNPALAGKPVIIGGDPKGRGVVSTCSYEAREYGVHSAMSCSEAYRRCPQAVFLKGKHSHYYEVSEQIQEIFRQFTPLVMPLSCDEAFLDVTGMERLLGQPEEIAENIRQQIFDRVRLTASAGLAGTMFVAKIASDMNKPDGLTVIRDDEVLERLAPLPVGRIWGLGKVGVKRVYALGIRTIADLQRWPEQELILALGNMGGHLFRLCRGIDERVITGISEAEKSISNEVTFDHDLLELAKLERCLLALADKVAKRCRRHGVRGKVVQLKVKYADFKVVTRRVTLAEPVAAAQIIFATARELLREKTEAAVRPIRLIGVGMSSFCGDEVAVSEGVQASLFADRQEVCRAELGKKMEKAEKAADLINSRFGGIIGRGSLLLEE